MKSPLLEKEKMWIIIGTLQLIEKKLAKTESKDRDQLMQSLRDIMTLGTLRFRASEYDHTLYYKLIIRILDELFKEKNSDLIMNETALIIKMWFNILTISTDPDLASMTFRFIERIISLALNTKKKASDLVYNILLWYSDMNNNDYDEKQSEILFSTHYWQSIDLFLSTFKSDAEDSESSKLVSEIFNNIMSVLNKPSKSASFAKIWNELFKCLAVIGSNENNVNKFVSTFLSLPGDIQDNLYTYFDIDNVNLDSSKNSDSKKFDVSTIYKILRSFFKYGLVEGKSRREQLRVYTIWDDLICKLATNAPLDVNLYKNKTPVTFSKEEYIDTLHLFNEYLNCYLNKGYYNHMAGADYLVLSRLKMGLHLSYLVYNSEVKGKKLWDMFINQFDDISISEKAEVFEKQIMWLLLNHPTSKSKSDPCSMQHQRITKTMIESLPTK